MKNPFSSGRLLFWKFSGPPASKAGNLFLPASPRTCASTYPHSATPSWIWLSAPAPLGCVSASSNIFLVWKSEQDMITLWCSGGHAPYPCEAAARGASEFSPAACGGDWRKSRKFLTAREFRLIEFFFEIFEKRLKLGRDES